MALPVVIAKNQIASDIELTRIGVVVPGLGQVSLTGGVDDPATFFECATDESLLAAVTSGDIIINDGTSDLTTAEGLVHLNASGNLNGPVTGFVADALVKLSDSTTGRYTTTTGILVDPSDNMSIPGSIVANGSVTATGGVVTGGSRNYGQSATDPVSPTPSDGDLYYNTVLMLWMSYDAARAKWLSLEVSQIAFGRNGVTGKGAYYKGINGLSFKSDRGRHAEYNGTIVSLTYMRKNSSTATFEVTSNGSAISTVLSNAAQGSDLTLNSDFAQGVILGVRNQSGGSSTDKVMGWVRIRWRV